MARKQAKKERPNVVNLRAELEGRQASSRETKPFVAHGGKPPAPPEK
jgi:hypothetical protein